MVNIESEEIVLAPRDALFELLKEVEISGYKIPAGTLVDLDIVKHFPILHGFVKNGKATKAMILLSYLRQKNGNSHKQEQNKAFMRALIDVDGISVRKATLIYYSVKLFGIKNHGL